MRTSRYLAGAVAIIVSYALLFMLGPVATDMWVAEDQIAETVSALALLATGVFFLLILLNGRRDKRLGTLKQIILVGLVLLFLVAAGEEVSWGQRYFGVTTPSALQSRNAQGELNLHNDKVFSGWLNSYRLMMLFWITFGVLIPVVAASSKRARAMLDRVIPVLPLWVAGYLIFATVVAKLSNVLASAFPHLYEGRYYPTYPGAATEITEAVIAVLLALGAYALYRRAKTAPKTSLP